jgi:hypothetical protein
LSSQPASSYLRSHVQGSAAAEGLRARPPHDGTIGAEGSSAALYVSLLKQLAIMEAPVNQWPGYPRSEWPDIRWATDRTDYGRPMVFDPNAKAWARDGDGRSTNRERHERVREFCGRGH